MAAMTSPHPEGASVEQKELPKMASLGSAPTSNGINGHPSPIATPPDSASQPAVVAKAGPAADDSIETGKLQNRDAFVSNQTLEAAAPAADPPASTTSLGGASSGGIELASEHKSEEAAAPVAPPSEKTPPSTSQELENAAAPSAPKSAAAASPPADAVIAAAPVESQMDVEMKDAQPHVEASASQGESTQNTDAPTATSPADEQASAPATADTSINDMPSQAPKVARDRPSDDEDDLDEPLAKRARTEDRDAIEALPAPAQDEAQNDAMAVDVPAADASQPNELPPRTRPEGPAGTLGDPAQEKEPISAFGNKEIRKVLASVKKTKAGGYFKDPVRVKWPELWEAYTAKIEKPMDITTMEKTLRENGYATLGDFVSDVYLIRDNAILFNGPEHMVTAQAASLVENIFSKLTEAQAQEPQKPEKKESKQVATRHAEPRAAAAQARRESRGGAAASPTEEVAESPVFALPPSGVPIIRRESTKNDGDRPKRPIHPPKNKDLGYEPKNLKKKKMSPEFRFCDEVLKELVKARNWNANQWFLAPVDPVRDNVPTYHKVIKKPMDLGTMQDKLNMGEYSSAKDFENDLHLIVKNCRKFNGENPPTPAAEMLLELFKQKWAEKDEWMAAHAPPPAASASASASSPGGAAKDDTEDEADASEQEVEEEAAPETSDQLESLTARYKEEQRRLSEMLTAKTLDNTSLATQNSLIQFLMQQIIDEKTRLAAEAPKKVKKTAAKSKPAKPKKAAASAGGAAGGNKRNSTSGAGAGTKKVGGGSKKAARRVLGQTEKNIVADAINNLDGSQLERAIDIIKRDTKQEESASGELELDIDQLSQDALGKLYDIVIKAFPNLKVQEKAAPPEPADEPERPLAKPTKPKKHKPMGKAEQERKIEQIRELKAQFHQRGSGSQEPLPSVEEQPAQDPVDSDEESDADSEED